MHKGASRLVLTSLLATSLAMAVTGMARAVSGGGYSPRQQDCPMNADASNAGTPGARQTKTAVAGCHNLKLNVMDGNGHRYVQAGTYQTPNGTMVHSGNVVVDPNGGRKRTTPTTATFDRNRLAATKVAVGSGPFDVPTLLNGLESGVNLYFGADDNLDVGEHDGVACTGPSGKPDGSCGSTNGPSDGGAISAHVTPRDATKSASFANPVPMAGASEGSCADGFCQEATTQRQTIYNGTGSAGSRDVANYSGKKWDPYTCSSGDQTSEAKGPNGCGAHTIDWWRAQEARNVNAEPGVQVYEDPDPEGSPTDPVYDNGLSPTHKPLDYPLPAFYAGTCGVIIGGGTAPAAPRSALTNSAGQLYLSPTGC